MTLIEYKKAIAERQSIISQNRSRLMRHEPRLPVPVKPEPPLVAIAYEADGTYAGRLENVDQCPEGCTIKWEPRYA
jgi:hypothetical protein